ncbi:uncharacterized protein [Onthophagus taurus]|uniref:uncharacterized protein n=1 Tax=Onthophagus taurus TaxID=166361 RepID=UPI000C20D5EB|nr:uncharacterized protein LOC111424967 [Onthophagus taurus]
MADDTTQKIDPLNFHSCDTPRGMLYYTMEDLTKSQQIKLNDLRIKTVREDEQYLAGHPEVRACVALITRYVLQRCPRNNIHDVIAQFFSRSKVDIQEEINEYIKNRGDHIYEMDSAVGVFGKHMSSMNSSSFEDIDSIETTDESVSDSLKNIDVDFEQLTAPPSGTLLSSISEITDGGWHGQGGDEDKVQSIIHAHQMEDIIVSDILNKIYYDDEKDQDHSQMSTKVSFSPVVHTTHDKPLQIVDKQIVQQAVENIITEAAVEAEATTEPVAEENTNKSNENQDQTNNQETTENTQE